MKSILHVDMDAFFASVEVLEDPKLRGKPVIVGGTGNRGVVAACTYEARAFGVHSAMPTAQARRLCPHGVFLNGRHELYSAYSGRIFTIFETFTPMVEGISLDEAFLDVTGTRRLFGTPEDTAHAVRTRIFDETGLRASVGVATAKMIAKLASEAAKPRAHHRGTRPGLGVKVVPPGEELAFLHPLPVRALWGVGPATLKRLERFGVRTVGDLADVPLDGLAATLGPGLARHLHDLANGIDPRSVEPERATKSISHEETYRHDHDDPEVLRREVLRLSDGVASRLRAAGLVGRTVTLKVRFHDFNTITRAQSVPAAIDTASQIAEVASSLLAALDVRQGVRLLGVAMSNL
ncbi:MAG TPA: DNA polymerase IV, partial [Acidimicrobiales bacterium]|nr:DNA polymerase IV [Acidimicrobiales bacterium]